MTIYKSYTEYLYDWAMTLWYAGATHTPYDPELVSISELIHRRSLRAAYYEGVLHPDEYESVEDDDADDDYDCIPF